MEIALLLFGFLMLIVGVIGSVLPGLPGTVLVWLSLLLLHFSGYGTFTTPFLVITGIVMLATIALDYIVPALGAKKFGGSRKGECGATIGIFAGIFIGPWGIIIGPFAGAFIGELLHDATNVNRAFKAAWGSFVGFLFSTGIKLVVSLVFAWFFIQKFFFE